MWFAKAFQRNIAFCQTDTLRDMSWDLWYSKLFFLQRMDPMKVGWDIRKKIKVKPKKIKTSQYLKESLVTKTIKIMKQPEPIKTEPKTKTQPTSSASIYHQAKFSPVWCSTGPRSSFYIVQSFVLFNQTQIMEIEGHFLISFSLSGCAFAWKALSYLLESESELTT